MRLAVPLLLVSTTAVAAADPLPEPIWVSSITATSTFADKHDAYNPKLVLDPKTTFDQKTRDLRYNSAWCEGKKDEGIGEGITIAFARPTAIAKLAIKPGVWMTQALFDANNVITGLTITTDDKRTFTATPSGKREEVSVAIGGKPVSAITVAIAAVKKGKMNDSCITEISLGDGDAVASGFDSAAIAAYPAEALAIYQTLFDPPPGTAPCDAKKVAAFTDFPFAWVDVENTHAHDETKQFIRHKHAFASAAAFEKACKDGGFPDATGGVEAIESLGAGKLGVVFTRAESSQTMVLGAKNGHWRLLAIE